MASYPSFSIVPDAPSVPFSIARLIRAQDPLNGDLPDDYHLKSSHPHDPCQVPLYLPIPRIYAEAYPKLALRPYNIKEENRGSNVLAFLHNSAKRELADLVGVVIPALEHQARLSRTDLVLKEHEGFGEQFETWWKLLLRFFFFVAETNDEIVKLMVEPVVKVVTRHGDYKALKSIEKQRKSISDKYEFAMEYVFRAADKAMSELETLHDREKVLKSIEKLEALVKFVLDTMELVMNLGNELEMMMPDLEIGGLEYVIADNLSIFAKADKPVLIYTCARWMNGEEYVRPWIMKYGGLWGRMMYKSWQKAHKEQRAAVIENLLSSYLSV